MNKIIEIGNLSEKLGISASDVMESIEDGDLSFAEMYNLLIVANFFHRKPLPENWKLNSVELNVDRVIYEVTNGTNDVTIYYYENGVIELHDYDTDINSESGEYTVFNHINNRNIDELLNAYEEALVIYNESE